MLNRDKIRIGRYWIGEIISNSIKPIVKYIENNPHGN